jgi:DNA-binding FadR family transcriptional regulator
VRFHEITQGGDPASAEERHHDKAVLASLLVRANEGQRPISEDELCEAFGAKEKQQKLAITDALNRLDAAGLIERRGGKAIASEVATYLDHIMTL